MTRILVAGRNKKMACKKGYFGIFLHAISFGGRYQMIRGSKNGWEMKVTLSESKNVRLQRSHWLRALSLKDDMR